MERNKRTINLIKLYQKHKRISGRCHFIPSCSNYAIEAYQKFNWFYASFLTGFRILRCHPLAKRRVDLVPLTKEEKRKQKILVNLKKEYDSFYIDVIINNSLLYKEMESIDYLILTLEYLFGFNVYKGTSSYNKLEFLGKTYVRSNYQIDAKSPIIDENLLKQYLNILLILNNNGFIQFSNISWNLNNLSHSKKYLNNYSSDYHVVNTQTLPISYWENQIEKYFNTSHTIIGIENIDNNTLNHFLQKWKALHINIDMLTDKYLHSLNNEQIIIVTGENLSKPEVAYHLNCLIRFYNIEEIFDINKYNIIIPKQN